MINTFDIKKELNQLFPWHYDPMQKDTTDCPDLGKLNFDFHELKKFVLDLCKTQDRKSNGKGWSYYFDNGKIKEEILESRDEGFQKQFEIWLKSNWNLDNSCYYEFHDEELGDFYKPLIRAYEEKFGELSHKQLRVFVKTPMTSLGLHADTYGTYCRKHQCKISDVFRVMTFVENWQWGHYTLVGNTVCHQYDAGHSVQIKPNVLHCSGNIGFNPQITMNITGIKQRSRNE